MKIFKYVTEDTFDAFNWAIIERKLKFIGQVFTSKSPSRSAEDIDSSALSAAEIKALEEVGKPFTKEEEYTSKSARLSELTKELESEEKTGGIQKRENLDNEDIDLADGSYSLKYLADIKNQLKESVSQDEQEQGALLEDEEVGKKLAKCEEI